MVKIKKKYKEFINESLIKRPILDDSRLSFIISRDSKQLIESEREAWEENEANSNYEIVYHSENIKHNPDIREKHVGWLSFVGYIQ